MQKTANLSEWGLPFCDEVYVCLCVLLELLEKSESFIALQKWKNATEFI